MDYKKLLLPAILLLMICTFMMHNGALPVNIMEARNLTTAREMITENNWLKPTMNGELRLEKPPLPTWITASTMLLVGQDNLSLLRLPSAIAAMLLIFFLFMLVKELSDNTLLPWLVAGTASTTFYILFLARDISWDMFCHSFMMGAIWLLHKGLKNKKLNYFFFIGSAVLMGFSFLSKGPVSFYALLFPYLLALFFTRKNNKLTFYTKGIIVSTLFTLLISLIWPLYIFITFPEYAASVVINESTSWLSRDVRPIYHYWSFTVQTGIWVIPASVSLFLPLIKKQSILQRGFPLSLLWTLMAVALLSIIPEKKERYLFPVLIPLSITTAWYFLSLIDAFREGKADKWEILFLKGNGILMILVSFLIPLAFMFLIVQDGHSLPFFTTIFSLTCFWAIGFFLVRSIKQKNPLQMWLGMVLLVASATALLSGFTPEIINKNPEYRPYAELRHQPEMNFLPFYYSEPRDNKLIEVVWAIGRKIQFIENPENHHLPDCKVFVLLSPEPPGKLYPQLVLSGYTMETIGLFDANLQQRWGSIELRNWVTVFRKRE